MSPVTRWIPRLPRLSAAHVLMLMAGALAFVLVLVITKQNALTTPVGVAAHDLAPGHVITASSIDTVEVPHGLGITVGLSPQELLESDADLVVGRAVPKGTPIRTVDIADRGPDGTRVLTVPLDVPPSVIDWIGAGDHVDLIAVAGDDAHHVARSLLVADVSGGGGLGRGSVAVTFVVEPGQELAIAAAVASESVHLVRASRG